MNKAFLRGLVVAAVLLINCTLLSGFIERQMTVPVRECSPRYDVAVGSQRIPADAIRWEDGQSFLYAIQEGQGLTAGLWAKRVPVNVIGTEGAAAFVMEDESQAYVLYGSRPFQDGERVLPVEEGQRPAGHPPSLDAGGGVPLGGGRCHPLGGGGSHLVQPGSDAAFPGGEGAGPAGSGGAARPKRRNQLPGAGKTAQRAAVAGGGGPAGACHLAAGHPVLRGPGTRQGAGPGTWAAAWDAFWLGWAWFLCWAAPSCPPRCCQRAISLLGATTATCSGWRKRGWQLSRRMPAARSSSTSWGSGSGRPCSFWREGRRCSACFLSRWGCISEGALVFTHGAAVSLLSERRKAKNRKVGIGDALV